MSKLRNALVHLHVVIGPGCLGRHSLDLRCTMNYVVTASTGMCFLYVLLMQLSLNNELCSFMRIKTKD